MKNTAFIFPGQGSQYCGMEKPVPETDKSKEYFSTFERTFGKKLQQFTEDELRLTQYTQPALFTISSSYNSWLTENSITPTFMAGHSLGEISAMFASGVFSFEDGLRITKYRGEIMAKVSKKTPGGMCAVVGLSLDSINSLCEELTKYGVAEPVNINSKNQIVISGEKSAMEHSIPLAKKMGARLVIPLKVSAPFHSSLMKTLASEFTSFLQNIKFNEAVVPIIQNVDAQPHQNPEILKQNLVSQLFSAVRWTDTLSMLHSKGVRNAIEVGPKKVLTGLCRGFDISCSPIEQLVTETS